MAFPARRRAGCDVDWVPAFAVTKNLQPVKKTCGIRAGRFNLYRASMKDDARP
jgi:hypothetical protein